MTPPRHLLRRFLFRQFEDHHGSFACFALSFDRSAVRLYKLLCDGKAKAAICAFGTGFVPAPETVEDEWKVFRGDP